MLFYLGTLASLQPEKIKWQYLLFTSHSKLWSKYQSTRTLATCDAVEQFVYEFLFYEKAISEQIHAQSRIERCPPVSG